MKTFLKFNIYGIGCTAFILFFCLLPKENAGINDSLYADKIFHSLLFLFLCIFWIVGLIKQYTFKVLRYNAIKVSLIFCIFFGILIELLQEWGVNNRNGDISDVLFDTIGSFLGIALFYFIYGTNTKKYRL